jgi:two-component system sensor histidine kinase TctE
MLRELVRNLLHNAVHHSPPHGLLAIHVSVRNAQARLVIQDSGPGIDEELRLRLFQPFSAGDSRSGTGLGLAIVREIVTTLGGKVQMNNLGFTGTRTGLEAVVDLPLHQDLPERAPGTIRQNNHNRVKVGSALD